MRYRIIYKVSTRGDACVMVRVDCMIHERAYALLCCYLDVVRVCYMPSTHFPSSMHDPGDRTMYTNEAVQSRHALRHHPAILGAIDKYW